MGRRLLNFRGMCHVGTGRGADVVKRQGTPVPVSHPFGLLQQGQWDSRRVLDKPFGYIEADPVYCWGGLGDAEIGMHVRQQALLGHTVVANQSLMKKDRAVLDVEVAE